MTLVEVAVRLEEAGVAERSCALISLQRCQPARPPVYRDGDLYFLDPHDDDLDLWAFRLGLRPPKGAGVPRPGRVVEPILLPGPDVPLTDAELDEAWKDENHYAWSSKRLAVAVLDARGDPLPATEAVEAVRSRTKWQRLTAYAAQFKRPGSPVAVLEDGRWTLAAHAGETVAQVRAAVRERIAEKRRREAARPDPEEIQRSMEEWRRHRERHGRALSRMSRALLVAFPRSEPQAAALLDVGAHEITTFFGEELTALRSRLVEFEVVGAMEVRSLLRALGVEPSGQRLAELGPPQKTMQINRRGRKLKITTTLLVQGSCGISRPFGDEKKLREYLARGETTKLRRRLESDVKSLYALYEYGRLHGAVRLRWGFLDERLPAPWVHRDEPTLHDLKRTALTERVPLEVVVGSAPGWADPWSRAVPAFVMRGEHEWDNWLVDESGREIFEPEVQRARLATQE